MVAHRQLLRLRRVGICELLLCPTQQQAASPGLGLWRLSVCSLGACRGMLSTALSKAFLPC